ncbi:hypothetical protein GQ54DRAFT_339245 [Martensiomyces pterosporus]|nr:hypothetical protein GQ54DRAFT_339245 [Martensiomyces pterosporus]
MKWQAALGIALASIFAVASSQDVPRGSNQTVAVAHSSPQGGTGQQAHKGSSDNGKAAQQPDHSKGGSKGGSKPPEHSEELKGNKATPTSTKPTKSSTKDDSEGNGSGNSNGNSNSNSNGDSGDKKSHEKKPTKTHKSIFDDSEGEEEAEKEYLKRVKADKDAGKMPGRMKMIVPPRTVHTPLFELDSVVELSWDYDNNVVEVPEKLMISVQLPKDPHADPGTKPMLYDIAVNITGDRKRFYWDTKNDVPDGVGMREGNGYTMYFYDGDIGFRMSDVVPAGYLIKYAMPFAFYISRYERTNDGVPKNYNPNGASCLAPRASLTVLVLAVVAILQIG